MQIMITIVRSMVGPLIAKDQGIELGRSLETAAIRDSLQLSPIELGLESAC